MNSIIDNQIKILGESPTDIINKKNLKKIYEYMPVPREYKILWADIITFGGYPAGVVITNKGIVYKAPKTYIKQVNKEKKKQYKNEKTSEKKKLERIKIIYQILLWEDYDPESYSIEAIKENGTHIYRLKEGKEIITEFSSTKLKDFFENNALEYRKVRETLDTISDETVFAGLESVFVGDIQFNAAYGADQSKTGHGIYAEYAGSKLDKLSGEKSTTVGGDNAKNGPDKLVEKDGVSQAIQCKYCKTPGSSVGAAFKKNKATGKMEYRYYTLSNEPMVLEVPKDQYEKALDSFRRRITNGEVPGVTNPADAEKYVRKGNLTYAQARNLAKAGTFESLTYDAVTGAVECVSLFGVSALVTFGITFWQTKDAKKAAKASIEAGVKVFGVPFVGKLLASQLARTGLTKVMIPATDTLAEFVGPKTVQKIVNATRAIIGKKAIYGAAASKSFSKMLRTNFVVHATMFVVLEVSDTYYVFRKKMSKSQYVKNMLSLLSSILVGGATTIAAGSLTGIVGQKIGKNVNEKVGGAIGAAAGILGGGLASVGVKCVGNLFHEDDALITCRLFNACVSNLCIEYVLNKEDMDELIKILDNKAKEISKLQRQIMCADKQYMMVEDFMRPLFEQVVKKKKTITKRDEIVLLENIDDFIVECCKEESYEM